MQFSCESCKAQLQIADEKVRGRRLIVRCKRCGAKIAIADPLLSKTPPRVVESAPPQPATDTESTRAMDSDLLDRALQASRTEDRSVNGSPPTQRFAAPSPPVPANPAVWFAMLQGKQTGPLTRADLQSVASVRSVHGEAGSLVLTVGEPHVAIPGVLEKLRSGGWDLASLSTRHASLEDVFVTLTGRHLRDGEATP